MKHGNIQITNIFERTWRYNCDNEEGYMQQLKQMPNMVENIGQFKQQIKPVFDVDAYTNDIDIEQVKKDINSIFPDKAIHYAKREQRETKKGVKYSYRFYVDGVKIQSKHIKELIIQHGLNNNPIYDLSIYDNNKVLFLPFTNKKDSSELVPSLIPVNCNMFNCSASYILPEYEDWDLKMVLKPTVKEVKKEDTFINDEDVEVVDTVYLEKKLKNIIDKISEKRSDEYDNWTKFVWCIMNICKKEGISYTKTSKLIHQFSKKSKKYEEDNVDEFIDKNYECIREKSYGWGYLYQTCLKEDDPEYFESINCKTYATMKKEFEMTHAKILHPPLIIHYNDEKEYSMYSIKSCKDTYEHFDCKVSKIVKKETVWVKEKFIKKWTIDSKIRAYDRIVFKPPPLICKKNEFNTWVHFKIAEEPLIKTERDFFQEYCTYLKNLVGDEKVANYILARYASRIQKPAERTNVCLILCGMEGDGKNKLLEPIYKIMDKYTTMLDTAKKLYDTHSMFESNKLFILINEAGGVANFENSEVLKTRITETELSINPKGIQSYKIENLCDYDMTTNNFNVVKISDESTRRFLQVETTSYYRGNTQFFNDYYKDIVENPVALRQIYEGLVKFDISKVVPSGNFQDKNDKPTTNIEGEVKKQNRDKLIWFLEDVLKICHNKDKVEIKNDDLFIKFNRWCDDCKVKVEYNKIQFGIKLTQIMKNKLNLNGIVCIKKDTSHSKTTIYPQELKEYFEKLNGVQYEFVVEDMLDEE